MELFFVLFVFVFPSALATDLSEELAVTTVNSTAPLEFPAPNQNYPFVDNSSIRANLASHSENDTEVQDLLEKDADKEISETMAPPVVVLKPNPSEVDKDLAEKKDTEWIENGEDTEDEKFVTSEVAAPHVAASTGAKESWSLFDGNVAAILAGIFLVISVFAYAGLLLWRRFLEIKYGSREMLVNEDEFIDPDDLKHFSI